jgi:hypothetical protein
MKKKKTKKREENVNVRDMWHASECGCVFLGAKATAER